MQEIREKYAEIGVRIATNGFCTPKTLGRVIDIATSISFEIKAHDGDVHRMLTGASSTPVLRNAEVLATRARESIRVFRTVVIPGITEHQVLKIAEFITEIDPTTPYRLIGFRPNFIQYYHPGPGMAQMNGLAEQCKGVGLTDVAWSGYYPTEIPGGSEMEIAAQYIKRAGCHKYPRSCGECELNDQCPAGLLEPWR